MEHAAEAASAAAFVFIFLFCRWIWKNANSPIANWPLFGMLPGLIHNISTSSIHHYLTKILRKSKLTFVVKTPSLYNMDLFVTCDPKNIHYILSTNCTNFTKGPAFREIFDVLGDGLIGAESESESWRIQRKLSHTILSRTSFQRFLEKSAVNKLENGVFTILNHVSDSGAQVDMQDLFARFTFDLNCITLLGYDPSSLSLDFPEILFAKAVSEIEEVILIRHFLPMRLWKLMRWLNVGQEKKFRRGREAVDSFLYDRIATKREAQEERKDYFESRSTEELDYLSSFLKEEEEQTGAGGGGESKFSDLFLRDMVLTLLVAAKDTTSMGLSWFLWIVATNPLVAENIRQELKAASLKEEQGKGTTKRIFKLQELNNLVYFHAALCESLRLYPPAPFNHRSPANPDVLPSGHRVRRHAEVILHMYSIGRMEEIWGKDCLDFKPERWITDKGRIMHVPSSKFNVFGAGPRACVGKDLSMATMKVAAAAIIWNYQLEVVEGHQVVPDSSIVLHMRYGLKVKVNKHII